MKFSTTKSVKGVVAALLVAGAVTTAPAQAALIDFWDYEVDSGFGAFNPAQGPGHTYGVVGSVINAELGLPTVLKWGLPSSQPGANPGQQQSGLSVTSQVVSPPLLPTNGPAVDGAVLTHDNFTLAQTGDSLTDAVLVSQLKLYANPPGNDGTPEVTLGPAPFFIQFKETSNLVPLASCPAESETPCADIFVLLNPGNLVQEFVLDDYKYTVTLLLEGLTDLSDEACAAAGVAGPCVGLITQENQSTSFQTKFFITAVQLQVPEPGTVALLGLLVAGAGVVRRRTA